MAEKIAVRATVHLPRLGVGAVKLVNPEDPYIDGLLKGGVLVPVAPEPAPTSAVPEAPQLDLTV